LISSRDHLWQWVSAQPEKLRRCEAKECRFIQKGVSMLQAATGKLLLKYELGTDHVLVLHGNMYSA